MSVSTAHTHIHTQHTHKHTHTQTHTHTKHTHTHTHNTHIHKTHTHTHIHTRTFIWRNLLQLPENHTAYSALLDKGTHPAFANLHQTYPIKSRKLLRVLQR